MASLNRATLVGYLGKDPEIRRTQSGERVANLSLATSESWTDKRSGEKVEKTEWHRITIWNEGLVNLIEKYTAKGSQILVEGKIQTRKWTDQTGQERYTTEIVLSGFDSKIVLLGKPGRQSDSVEPEPKSEPAKTIGQELDDEIPF